MIMIGRLLYLLLAVLLTHSLEAFSTSEMKNRRIDDRHTLSPSSSRASGTKSSNNNNIIRRKTSDVASAAVVILSFQLLTVPVVSTAADIANGSKLFDYNCAACHRGGMNYVSEKKTLQKDAIEKYRKTTNVDKIQDYIQNAMPHRFMPFGNKFSNDDYTDVVSFVLDQALNDKWE